MAPQPGSAVVADEKPTTDIVGSASNDDTSDSSIQGPIPVAESPKKTWRSYVWDTFDKSPEERRFLFKLDAVVLTFASLGYFIKVISL